MAKGKKTGGRRRGTPNKITAELRQQAAASGKSLLQVMQENVRWADNVVQMLSERLATATGEDLTLLLKEILLYRGQSHLWATKAAPFFHPQLADVKHDHRKEDGKPIVPIIEITGYPEPKQIEQSAPTPALPLAKGKH